MKNTFLFTLISFLIVFSFAGFAQDLTIVKDGQSAYSIIYSEADESGLYNAQELAAAIEGITGCTLPVYPDSHPETACEIIIGTTSTRAFTAPTAAFYYQLAVEGNKLLITATDENHLILALLDFETLILKDKNLAGRTYLSFPKASNKVAEFATTQATLRNLVKNDWRYELTLTKLLTVPRDGNLNVSQGACTDGKYAYFVLRNSSDTEARVYKYLMEDWSFVAKTEIFNGGHCNDLAYDLPNKRIICIKGGTDGSVKEFSMVIDPETMVVSEGPNIPNGATAIDYNPVRNQFATRYGSDLRLRDANLAVLKSGVRTDGSKMTSQGMGTDEEFFYFPMSPGSGVTYNEILVYDWENITYQKTFKIPSSYESEALFMHDGIYYVSFYQGGNGATLYRINVILSYKAADWIFTESTLSIDVNEGENTMEQDVYSQAPQTYLTVTNPTRKGYDFVGWEGNGNQYITNYQGLPCSSSDTVVFNEATYFDLGREYMYEDAFTINVWAKMDNWSDYTTSNMRLFSCSEQGGFAIDVQGRLYVGFSGFDGSSAKTAKTDIKWKDLAAGWHMFTMIFDGKNLKGYVDGQLAATSTDFTSGKMSYHETNHLLLGAESGEDSIPHTSRPGYFKGQMKNFAILHAAITNDEVLYLFQHEGVARFCFPRINTKLKALWQEAPADGLENPSSYINICKVQNEVCVEGIQVAQLTLYSLTGQKLCEANQTNKLNVNAMQGVFILQCVDEGGKIYSEKINL